MADSKQDSGGGDGGVNAAGVLSLNNLSYRLTPDVSVASARNLQQQYFSSQSYSPGATCVAILNTGSNFVDFTRSFLVMTVRNLTTTSGGAATQAAWFGPNGSACNLINRLRVSTRSGTVIEDLQNCHQYASYKLAFERDATHTGRIGPTTDLSLGSGLAMMYGATPLPITDAAFDWGNGESLRFCIPFSAFSPVLGNSRSLWPGALCSGLRIEIILESPAVAMMAVTNSSDLCNFAIDEIYMSLENYSLSDMVLRVLNTQCASSGLEIVSSTVHDTAATRLAASLNLDCGKAASRSLGFVYRERSAQDLTDAKTDKFACYPISSSFYPTFFQSRVGSLYMPLAGFKNINGAGGYRTVPYEIYANNVQDRFSQMGGVATNLVQFMQSRFQIYQTLERSSVIDLSGIPLSNSRILNVQSIWNAAPSSATLVDLFLQYAVLIRVFLSGSNIES